MGEPAAQHETPYADFRKSRFYFGARFYWALGLAIVSIIVSVMADTSTPGGRAIVTLVALAGVVIGLLLQPSPKPEDHKPRARQAIQNLSTVNQHLDVANTIAGQLAESEAEQRTKVGLASISQELSRARTYLVHSMAEWDQIAPGAVSEFRATQNRGHQILQELSREEGVDSE